MRIPRVNSLFCRFQDPSTIWYPVATSGYVWLVAELKTGEIRLRTEAALHPFLNIGVDHLRPLQDLPP